jgi:hypothetical protein
MRPVPCLLPVLTRLGGLSTIDTNPGSFAGCAGPRAVCDICLQAMDVRAKGLLIPLQSPLLTVNLVALYKPVLDVCIVGNL